MRGMGYNDMHLEVFGRLACLAAISAGCVGCAEFHSASSPAVEETPLRDFLQRYLKASSCSEDRTTKYSAAFIDLNGDGAQEVIVYITGRAWCGSGGCTTLVLAPAKSGYRVISRIPITRPPIRILPRIANGWHSLGVWVEGGGVQAGYEAELSFDGRKYPRNPSLPPARRLAKAHVGEVVVSLTDQGKPLCR